MRLRWHPSPVTSATRFAARSWVSRAASRSVIKASPIWRWMNRGDVVGMDALPPVVTAKC